MDSLNAICDKCDFIPQLRRAELGLMEENASSADCDLSSRVGLELGVHNAQLNFSSSENSVSTVTYTPKYGQAYLCYFCSDLQAGYKR
jgi:hypothetical protein